VRYCSILFLIFFFNLHVGGESKLGPLGTSVTEWPIVPAPGDYDDGEIGGIKIGRGNRSTTFSAVINPCLLCINSAVEYLYMRIFFLHLCNISFSFYLSDYCNSVPGSCYVLSKMQK
jgi:hypothetical protein